jgi:Arc/MetJ-type ribon-helix-helix transcriptional regulator
MGKIPTTENTEIFTMRISQKLKEKLYQLVAKRSKYGGSASSAIRVLIENASRR